MTTPNPPTSYAEASKRPEGHCGDDGAWAEFVRQNEGKTRANLCMGDMSDFAMANAVFMASRDDLDLIVAQTGAKERIRWLSICLAQSLAANQAQAEELKALREAAKPFGRVASDPYVKELSDFRPLWDNGLSGLRAENELYAGAFRRLAALLHQGDAK